MNHMEEKVNENKESFFKKNKKLILEIIRFLLVGGFATLVDWAISFFVTSITPSVMVGNLDITHTVLSTACGFSVGLLVNYFLSVVFVFKDKKDENSGKSFKDFLVFALIGILVLLFQFLLIYLVNDLLFVKALEWTAILIGNLSWGYIIAKVFATAIGLVLNYIFRKIFVFK
ncbi:MAG: GtrA family protein [Bacilli bacterium]|nr:GtrA family protein [Bacilli bacterium]